MSEQTEKNLYSPIISYDITYISRSSRHVKMVIPSWVYGCWSSMVIGPRQLDTDAGVGIGMKRGDSRN